MGNAQILVSEMLNNTSLAFFLKKCKKMNVYLEHILCVFDSFKNCIDLKLMISSFVLIFGFLFNVNSWEILAGLLILVLFDFVSAIVVAKTTGEQIESRKAVRSAFKMVVYGIIISAGHLVDKCMGITTWVLTAEYVCLTFLSSTEFISILENFGKAGFSTPQKLLNTFKKYTNNKENIKKNCKSCN